MTKNIVKHAASIIVLVLFSIMAIGSADEQETEILKEGTVVDKGFDTGDSMTIKYQDSFGETVKNEVQTRVGDMFWIEIRNDQGRRRRIANIWPWDYFRIEIGDHWQED